MPTAGSCCSTSTATARAPRSPAGDVDTADHVAVLTPGFGNTVGGDLPGVVETAGALRDRSAAVLDGSGRSGESVAAVAWLGYDVPGGPLDVSTADAARRGGADLARFYDGIDAARPTDPHLTALGHSYGSLTTGYALQQAHGVDDAVLFGSPGIGTDDLGDLHVPAGHTGVVEAPWDPVADLGWFGDDPNRLDGVTGLSARAATLPDGTAAAGSVLHSQYLTPGTTSQYNIAATVAGLPDQRILDPGVGVGDVLRGRARPPARLMIGRRPPVRREAGAVLARAHPARPLERRAQREGGAVADPAGDGGQRRVGVAQQVRRQRQAPARQELHRRLAHQLGEAAGQCRAGDPGRGGERADRPRPRRVVVQQLQRPADERVRVGRVPGGRLRVGPGEPRPQRGDQQQVEQPVQHGLLAGLVAAELRGEQRRDRRVPLGPVQHERGRQGAQQARADLAVQRVRAREERRRTVRVVSPRPDAEPHGVGEVVSGGVAAVAAGADEQVRRAVRVVRDDVVVGAAGDDRVARRERDRSVQAGVDEPGAAVEHGEDRQRRLVRDVAATTARRARP